MASPVSWIRQHMHLKVDEMVCHIEREFPWTVEPPPIGIEMTRPQLRKVVAKIKKQIEHETSLGGRGGK